MGSKNLINMKKLLVFKIISEGVGVKFPTFPLTFPVVLQYSGTAVPACDFELRQTS